MFESGTHKILMKYTNTNTSVADMTGGFLTMARTTKDGFVEYFVDNLNGQKQWMRMMEAFRVSPALRATMIEKYRERYQHSVGEKQVYKKYIYDAQYAK